MGNERQTPDERNGYGIVTFRRGVFVSSGVKIRNSGGTIFGEDAFVSLNTDFVCVKKISIGAFCKISWNCTFLDCDFHKIIDMESGKVTKALMRVIVYIRMKISLNVEFVGKISMLLIEIF